MKNLIKKIPRSNVLILGALLFLTQLAQAHDDVEFEYICSVSEKSASGQMNHVVNVVFLPDWQKLSHLYSENGRDIWFEIVPIKNGMGEIEKYEMHLRLHLNGAHDPSLLFTGPEFSEIGFANFDANIGAHCFHRSQRGKKSEKN
jgi:hypothetical protein